MLVAAAAAAREISMNIKFVAEDGGQKKKKMAKNQYKSHTVASLAESSVQWALT